MDDAHDSRPSPQKRVETCLYFFCLFIYLLNTVCSKVQKDRFVLGVKQFTNCYKKTMETNDYRLFTLSVVLFFIIFIYINFYIKIE